MAHHIPPPKAALPLQSYIERAGHQPAILWFTGLSGAGKTTLASKLGQELFNRGCQTVVLDGDDMRHGLCKDLGFSAQDRSENIRRVAEVGKMFFLQGNIVISTFISPFEKDRLLARELFPKGSFFEVHVDCSLEECIRRDTKGLYQKAISGEIPDFTGISSPYEAPVNPEFRISTHHSSVSEGVTLLVDGLDQAEIFSKKPKDNLIEPFFYKSYRLDCVYGVLTNSVRDEILNFWTANKSIPSSEEAQRRTKEVVFTIRNEQQELVGVNTVYLHPLKEGGVYYMYRTFIRRQDRTNFNLTRFAFWESKKYLKELSVEGAEVKGIALVAENPKLMGKAVRRIFEEGPMRYYGKTPQGLDLWFTNFDDPSALIK